jgi:hypothetical protein
VASPKFCSKVMFKAGSPKGRSAVEKNGPSSLLQRAFVERNENAVSSLLEGGPARGDRILCGIALRGRRLPGLTARSWYFPGVPSLTIAHHTGQQRAFAPAQPKYYA